MVIQRLKRSMWPQPYWQLTVLRTMIQDKTQLPLPPSSHHFIKQYFNTKKSRYGNQNNSHLKFFLKLHTNQFKSSFPQYHSSNSLNFVSFLCMLQIIFYAYSSMCTLLLFFIFLTPTTPGIPRWSPIQVLMRSDSAWFPRSDEIQHIHGGMAVDLDVYFNHTNGIFFPHSQMTTFHFSTYRSHSFE